MEVIVILFSIIAGIMTGVITGLIPGIHVNTIAAIMVSLSTVLYGYGMDGTSIAVYIASVAVTHAFFDYIPSLFLGVPNDEVFALLPGHRMVREGRGIEALNLSIKGSWNGVQIGVVILIIVLIMQSRGIDLLGAVDAYIRPYLFWILLTTSLILILSEARKIWALLIFMLSGLFGIIVLGSPLVPSTGAAFNGLFPALAGIFGVSGLILSLFERTGDFPEQKNSTELPMSSFGVLSSSVRGTGAGMAVGLLPGLGAANAATLLLMIENYLGKNKKRDTSTYSYIVTTSAINTSDTLFGIAALYFIEKTRSGASVAMSQLFDGTFPLFALVAVIIGIVISGFVAMTVMQHYSMYIAYAISKLDFKELNLAVLIFLVLFIYLTLGSWGIVILMGGAYLGLLPPLLHVRRAQAMGFFLVPVMLFYSGHQANIVSYLHLEAKIKYYEELDVTKMALYLLSSLGVSSLMYILSVLIKRVWMKR
ncbi:tripartite tricarboxylate transporter permease [Exiguobacterium algae]|uniref:tripartite tricarboxylate transporter permease n=1 Tax=Exiguobacterium algae TaxID=2751250 RepID=UPI001BE79BEC|nr:tripartite tricarboxylate transporter permease [Exiguobacterium algae]